MTIEINVDRAPYVNGSELNAYLFTDAYRGPVFRVYPRKDPLAARSVTYLTVNGDDEDNLAREVRENLLQQGVREGPFTITIITRGEYSLFPPTSEEL